MYINIDARGLACPKPVIHTKKELDKEENTGVVVIVDNTAAKQNILKLASKMGYEVVVVREENNEIEMKISKNSEKNTEQITIIKEKEQIEDKYILISSDEMGKGSKELGQILINGFVYALTESTPYPKYIIFVNSGVKLTTENNNTIESLNILAEKGVNILTCGTCLDYYDLKDKLSVGEISNMYTIVESMKECSTNISI